MVAAMALLTNAAAALLSLAGPLPVTALSPPHFEIIECATCLAMLLLARTPFSRQCFLCGLLRVLALGSGIWGRQSAAALVGLADLAWAREQLFDDLMKSRSRQSWVVGACKASLVLDVNARLLEVLGVMLGHGTYGWYWIRFVLVAITLSVWLMARASPTYCSIIVLSLAAVILDVYVHPGPSQPSGLLWWIAAADVAAAGFALRPLFSTVRDGS